MSTEPTKKIPFNESVLNETTEGLWSKAQEKYCEEHNTEEAYEETLNELYGEVEICGMSFQAGSALKELDPIAFQCGNADQSDMFYEEFESSNDMDDFRDQALEVLNMEDEFIGYDPKDEE
jgi:hypothetical protein